MIEQEGRRYAVSSLSNIMYRVYGWMAAALAVTGVTAYVITQSPILLHMIYSNPFVLLVLILAQFGMVIAISAGISGNRIGLSTGLLLFFGYSFLVGATLSSIFMVYTYTSIAAAFFITGGMFATLSVYGYLTKVDLTTVGSISLMAIWGLLLAMIVNMFLRSSAMGYVISMVGVVLFSLLTAYDTQKIKQLAQQFGAGDQESIGKVALLGALTLYLDFLNLFLFILRLMGNRRD